MDGRVFPFTVGDFKCLAVLDGYYTYTKPAPLLFPTAPKEELAGKLKDFGIDPDRWLEWKSSYTCLFVDTGQRKILVDTGAGIDENPGSETGHLIKNLKSAGVSPEEIDLVIITHAHPDHISGNTDENGKLAFPNAIFAVCKDEWDFWNSDKVEKELPETFREGLIQCAREKLPPIENRLSLITKEEELMEGVKPILTKGHTPGHLVVSFSSRGKTLLVISDLFVHPIHLEKPEWVTAVDFNPQQNVESRLRILEKAEKEKALIMGFHFSFPGLGYVTSGEKGWKWIYK